MELIELVMYCGSILLGCYWISMAMHTSSICIAEALKPAALKPAKKIK